MFEKLIKDIPRTMAEYSTHVIGALLFLLLAWVFARFVDRLLRRVLEESTDIKSSHINAIARTASIVIVVIATIEVLEELGVDIASLIAALGIFGFAIALGLRTSLANFFTGMMIHILRPYDVGDHIEGERIDGAVERIGAFNTEVVAGDGTYISVPNSAMWARSIKNLSRPRPFRIDLTLTVGRELPFAEIVPMIDKIVRTDPVYFQEFPPEIRILDTTAQALIIRVAAWCAAEEAWAFGDRLKQQIGGSLGAAGATVKKMIVIRKRPRPAKKPSAKPTAANEDLA